MEKIMVVGNKTSSAFLTALAMMGMAPATKKFTASRPVARQTSHRHAEAQACARRRRQIERGILKKENGLQI